MVLERIERTENNVMEGNESQVRHKFSIWQCVGRSVTFSDKYSMNRT
jgi:hypothetical protein